MRFLKNTFPNTDFEPEKKGYTKMQEPSMEKLLLVAIPVGVVAAFVLYLLAQILTETQLDLFWIHLGALPVALELVLLAAGFILFNVLIIIAHELVHALCFPKGLLSEYVGFGFHKSGAFFAFYTEAMPRRRMIIAMFAPFVLFTIVPWLTVIIFNINRPLLLAALLYHALLASGDLVGLYLVIKNTPKFSVLKNKGYYTYYK